MARSQSQGWRRTGVLAGCLLALPGGACSATAATSYQAASVAPSPPATPERSFPAQHGLVITVKEVGPTAQPSDLQVITLFNKASGQAFTGSMVELDKRLGGMLRAVRDSGQFQANALETLLIKPPPGTIAARRLLIVGLGDARRASLPLMKAVGAVAAREAVRTRAVTVSFAPTLRDQSFSRLNPGQVAAEVVQGALLAYDTDARLQRQGLQPCFALKRWYLQAGATYYTAVAAEVGQAVKNTATQVERRSRAPFGKTGPSTCRT
jgi:Cytosol aminopeptidase family, N-terminal domain